MRIFQFNYERFNKQQFENLNGMAHEHRFGKIVAYFEFVNEIKNPI